MDFRILGPFEVWEAQRLVEIPAPKQRAILAVLVLNAGQVVSADRLLDLVWGDEQPDGGTKTLWYHISKLRDRLEPDRSDGDEGVLLTKTSGYLLAATPDQIDASIFEKRVAEAHHVLSGDPGRATSLIDEALQLWRGPALADFAYEEFARPEIIRLDELRQQAVEDRIDARLALGAHRELIGEITALTKEHPLRERYWGQLMVALSRSGRQAEALDTYQVFRKRLGEELGIEPSDELRALEERVLLQDPELLAPGPVPSLERLRGYVLRERLGAGVHGEVWRATQPGVGRDVAIKAIRSDLANRPEFVRRFEREAQVVAAMEHPHVVSLFDFWRDPDGAYLVMPFLQGGNLQQLLQKGNLQPGAALSVVTAVGQALGFVHRHGMVHQDVTPGNVLFDGEGNAYLADLGVAVLAGAAGSVVTSSPAYVAPEQLAGSPATERSDIFSLGVLTFAVLTGTDPAPDTTLPSVAESDAGLTAKVDDVIGRATAPQPDHRFSDVNEFLLALGEALGAAREMVMSTAEVRNPYKGLRAFQEPDAGDFFGRDAMVAELVGAMAAHRLLGVVGPSGCGKSSLVRAGLIPAIRAGALPDSDRWIVTDMYPGSRPLAELEAALIPAAVEEPPANLMEQLCASDAERRAAIDRLLPASSELVVIVDQFEELFTLTADEAERRRFLDLLAAWGRDRQGRVRVIVTLRADFYDRPLEYPEFGDLLRLGVVSVTMPSASNLAQAVTGPAQEVGVTLDAGLEHEIVRDVSDQPGGLPLMQFALTELFSERSGAQLTTAAYQRTGGVLGSLGRRAEELYAYHDETGRATVRQVFLRLVTVDEGMADTRRRIPIAELQALDIDPESLDAVLTDYGSHRLLTFDRDPESRAPTVEVAHEALLTQWDRLRNWIDDRRDDLVLHRRLTASAAEWQAAEEADTYLVSGGRLDHYEQFAANTDLALTDRELAYLATSRRREDDQQRRRRRTRRLVAGVLGAAAGVAALLAIAAFASQQRANEASDVARSRELAASAINVLDEDVELSVLLALEAARGADPTFESVSALHQAILDNRLLATIEDAHGIISPDGESIITTGREITSWSTAGVARWEYPLPVGRSVVDGYFSTDGSHFIVLTAWDEEVYEDRDPPDEIQRVHWIDSNTGAADVQVIAWPCFVNRFIPNGAGRLPIDGPLIMGAQPVLEEDCEDFGAVIALEKGETREILTMDPAELSQGQWTTGGDGRYLALGVRERSTVIDLETLDRSQFGPLADYGSGNALSSDGTRLLTIGNARNDLWDLESDSLVWRFAESRRDEAVWFSGDDSAVVTADGIFDTTTGQAIAVVLDTAEAATLSDSGDLLLTAGDDTRLWNTRPQGEVAVIRTPHGPLYGMQALELGGGRGAVQTHAVGSLGIVTVFDIASGDVVTTVDETTGQGIALSANGRLLAVQDREGREILGTIRIHDLPSGTQLAAMEGLCRHSNDTAEGADCRDYPEVPFRAWINDVEFSADGSLLVAWIWETGADRSVVAAWEVATGDLVFSVDTDEFEGREARAPSPDGRRLFAYDDGVLQVLDPTTETEITVVRVNGFWRRVSPDGRYLVDRGDEAALAVFDAATGAELGFGLPEAFEGDIWDYEIAPDGATIALGLDGMVEVRRFPSFELDQRIPFDSRIRNVEYLTDTHLLVTPDWGPGIVVTTDVPELIEIARNRIARDLTAEECATYRIDPCPSDPES